MISPRTNRHTYSVMSIARRHPLLFSRMLSTLQRLARAELIKSVAVEAQAMGLGRL